MRYTGVHDGKRFLVTGGGRGIGQAVAEVLHGQGAQVVVTDLLEQNASTVAEGLGGAAKGAYAMKLNVADTEEVGQVVPAAATAMGGLDGVAHCAGIVVHADPLAIPRDDWFRQLDINVIGAYEVARHAAEQIRAGGGPGAIVTVASEAGKAGHIDSLAYSASKAALINATRMLADVLAKYDINVNSVCPGGVDTAMLREVADVYGALLDRKSEDVYAQMVSKHLRRHTQPIEVARVISFLLSDDALLIRGQSINVDAGET
ncbi:hypothetical protein BJM39_10520, partial [Salmonella enterica subsp. enterica serovar Javiana]